MNLVTLIRAGRIGYLSGLKLQQHFMNLVKANRGVKRSGSFLLLLEHEPVYTVGIRDRKEYARDKERFAKLGADYVETNRGGLITFHGPGQLVAYPILDLRQFFELDQTLGLQSGRVKQVRVMGMRWYVQTLEQTVIDTLERKLGLDAHRSPHTGVWVGNFEDERKICAVGVHNSDLVTSHGIALNCNNDLGWFDHIVPCGIEGKGVTSVSAELRKNITVEDVVSGFIEEFEKNFKCEVNPG